MTRSSSKPLSSLRALACVGAFALLAPGAFAQRSCTRDHGAGERGNEKVESILRERNRSQMHTGDALELVGVEQGDNEIRSRTPVLAQSDRAAAMVDPEEAHQRALAMYDERASFGAPPRTTSFVSDDPSFAPRVAHPPIRSPLPSTAPSPGWSALLVFGIALLVVVALQRWLSRVRVDGRVSSRDVAVADVMEPTTKVQRA